MRGKRKEDNGLRGASLGWWKLGGKRIFLGASGAKKISYKKVVHELSCFHEQIGWNRGLQRKQSVPMSLHR